MNVFKHSAPRPRQSRSVQYWTLRRMDEQEELERLRQIVRDATRHSSRLSPQEQEFIHEMRRRLPSVERVCALSEPTLEAMRWIERKLLTT
jgi:hypothetical protein